MGDQNKKPFHCTICGKDFSLNVTFKAHTVLHNREAPYKCGWCGEVFMRNSIELKNHMRKHLEAESEDEHNSQDLSCTLCGKKLSTKSSLKKHMQLHNLQVDEADKAFKCNICKKKFGKKECLKIHVHLIHSGEKPTFTCEICSENFESKTALARHFRQHKDELQYKCIDCGKVFRSKKVLGNHKKRKHCDEIIHSSHENNISVSSIREYINPIEVLPDSIVEKSSVEGTEGNIVEKQYTCSSCGKQLNSHKSVLNHMLMHAETVLYSCKVCGIAFSNKTLLAKHEVKHDNYSEAEEGTKVLCEAVESQEKITLYIKNDCSPNKLNNKRKVFMLEERGPYHDQAGYVANKKWKQGVERDKREDVMVINEDVVIEVEEVIIAEKEDEENLNSSGVVLDPLV
ncbi:zinc finger protein OZF-like [Palaemon carinicauda]|uniref:zinc finger protein OZF-like n=1 Tax=Palaemon carinicauda TaxID=392227 RepID=UPI0035B608B8